MQTFNIRCISIFPKLHPYTAALPMYSHLVFMFFKERLRLYFAKKCSINAKTNRNAKRIKDFSKGKKINHKVLKLGLLTHIRLTKQQFTKGVDVTNLTCPE